MAWDLSLTVLLKGKAMKRLNRFILKAAILGMGTLPVLVAQTPVQEVPVRVLFYKGRAGAGFETGVLIGAYVKDISETGLITFKI